MVEQSVLNLSCPINPFSSLVKLKDPFLELCLPNYIVVCVGEYVCVYVCIYVYIMCICYMSICIHIKYYIVIYI